MRKVAVITRGHDEHAGQIEGDRDESIRPRGSREEQRDGRAGVQGKRPECVESAHDSLKVRSAGSGPVGACSIGSGVGFGVALEPIVWMDFVHRVRSTCARFVPPGSLAGWHGYGVFVRNCVVFDHCVPCKMIPPRRPLT